MAEVVRRLGETGYGRNNGRVGILDLLACAGLLVHEGLVFTQRAHREFLQTSGVLLDIEAAARRGEDARGRDATRALIAVGSRGLTRRLRLGSVSTKMLRAAGGPILVYTRAEI
jgi:nucleotide-binding universal stress UspA family protein